MLSILNIFIKLISYFKKPLISRRRVYNSITETVGATPIVRLNNLEKFFKIKAKLYAKLEFFNPLGSTKDRIGVALINDLEKRKILNKDSIIVEPSSGNTGIALAFVAASKNIRCVIVIPDSVSIERRKMLHLLGAKIIFSDKNKGIKESTRKAKDFVKKFKFAIMPNQFENLINPNTHRETTAEEIYSDIGCIDYLIIGIGTGGTITGVGEMLKERCVNLKIIAVEPKKSSVLSGGTPGIHKIQGLGAGFIPKILNTEIYDEIAKIKDSEAFKYAKLIAKIEGIPVGISSGAIICAAIKTAIKLKDCNEKVLAILPSFAERYTSTELFKI